MFTTYLHNKDNFKKLNSITKYPSILTYHKLEKGLLKDEVLTYPITELSEDMLNMEVEGTEKVHGTNVRILIKGSDFIIGSREDLLYSKGDRVVNKELGICDFMLGVATELTDKFNLSNDEMIVLYGEFYGATVGVWGKNYSEQGVSGFRLFDMFKLSEDDLNNLMNKSPEQIALWRARGGQPYSSIDKLKEFTEKYNLHKTPVLFSCKLKDLHTSLDGMYNFIKEYEKTKVGFDVDGKSEGIVVRSIDRGYIVKIRFEDYERTFKRLQKVKK